MSSRKFQAEVDRVLKRIQEGLDEFKSLWDKYETADSPILKDKYEAELKREIKKLQKLREQIKNWASSGDVKNKKPLLEYRRLIEVEMERFKVLERESKMKAFSKEGLMRQAIIDPEVALANQPYCIWLQETIETLQEEVSQFEEQIEAIQEEAASSKGRGGHNQSDLDDLTRWKDSHEFHLEHLELALEKLENNDIVWEQVEEIKDGVQYYLESYQEENYYDDDSLYEVLEETPDEVEARRSARVVLEEPTLAYPIEETDGDATKDDDKQPSAPPGTAPPQHAANQQPGKDNRNVATTTPPPPPPPPPLVNTSSNTNGNDKAAHRQQQMQPPQESSWGSIPGLISPQPGSAWSSGGMNKHSPLTSTAPTGADGNQQSSNLLPSTVSATVIPLTHPSAGGNVYDQKSQQQQQQVGGNAMTTPPPPPPPPVPQQQSPTGLFDPNKPEGGDQTEMTNMYNLSAAFTLHYHDNVTPSTKIRAGPPSWSPDYVQQLRSQKFTQQQQAGNAPKCQVLPKEPLAMFNRQPQSIQSVDPNNPSTVTLDIYSRLSAETLRFICYHKPGTAAHYHAAIRLKAMGWRFHTGLSTWVYRLAEYDSSSERAETSLFAVDNPTDNKMYSGIFSFSPYYLETETPSLPFTSGDGP